MMNTLLRKLTLTAVLTVLILGSAYSIALAETYCYRAAPPEGMIYCIQVDPGGGSGGGGTGSGGGGGW